MKRRQLGYLTLSHLLLILLITTSGLPLQASPPSQRGLPLTLTPLDIPRQWVELVQEQVDKQGLDLPATARLTAYLMITLYEATLPDMAGATSLAGKLTTMPALPQPKVGMRYDSATVAIGALASVAEALLNAALPTETARRASARNVASLRINQSRLRLQSIPVEIIDRSLTLGDALGAVMATWAATDGATALRSRPFVIPTGADRYWQATTPTQAPVQPFWGSLPGLIQPDERCTVPLRLAFATEAGSTFHYQAMEVYQLVKTMTPEQAEIVNFWGYETPGATVGAGNVNRPLVGNAATRWLLLADQVAQAQKMTLAQAAALYAPIALSLHETIIAVWRTQYAAFLLRPASYIRQWIEESWQPLYPAPNTPAYPSPEAAIGAAAAAVLTARLGFQPVIDYTRLTDDTRNGRRFTTFDAAAYEHGMAALYAGTTFRTAVESGLQQGQCIGYSVVNQLSAETKP
ncbi:MAG: hypothetical protein ACOYNY_00470 [Caldilineaceae bacterium]